MPEWVIRHAQGRLHMAEQNLVKARVELQEAVSLVRSGARTRLLRTRRV